MRATRLLPFVASAAAALALALTLGPATAQTSAPSAKEVAAAKAALATFTAAHAPKSEAKPTSLGSCPFGDQLVTDLAGRQAGYDATATGTPTVMSSVYLDQSIDKGTKSVACTADYTDTAGNTQSVSIVAYGDPGLKTAAFAKGFAKQVKGTSKTVSPPSPSLAGGKVEGYCVKGSGSNQCAYVWSRNGLFVEIDSSTTGAANFTELGDVAPAAIAAMPALGR
jgi:hypothetical protein